MPVQPSRRRIILGTYGLPIVGDIPFVQDMSFFRHAYSISMQQARAHMHIIGKTGSGKSFFMAILYINLMKAGFGVALLDPHGTLAPLIFSLLAADGFFEDEGAFDKLLYLDLARAKMKRLYLPFNVFKQYDRFGKLLEHETIAAHFKDAMHRAFPELAQGAAIFDTLLPRSIRVLMHYNMPLTMLEPFLLHDKFRDTLIADYPEPMWRYFFTEVVSGLRKGEKLSYVGSLLRRAQQLIDTSILKYTLSSQENKLPFRTIIDSKQSMIVSCALEDQEAMRLLVCLMTVGFHKAAMSRADLGHDALMNPYMLMIDEFAPFVPQSGDAFSEMFSQTRKYELYLCLAHQNWSQSSEKLKGAMGNCELDFAFRLSRDDAEHSAKQMGHVDPRSLRQNINHDESQSHGMLESWEEWCKAFQDQRPRSFYLGMPDYGLRRKLLKWSPNKVVKLKSPSVHKPQVDPAYLGEIEQEYFRRYFYRPSPAEQQAHRSVFQGLPAGRAGSRAALKPVKVIDETEGLL